ncbi:MAG: Tm-1-like ATP-binding domain-containing protein [Roseibium sp.]|uniref:Tm-1-like ATP-binding domain-containing protein n=1 Tax=Alphaproteobacteria TaxID=28211 RepID=UPI003297E379
MKLIYVVGTCDTKQDELFYTCEAIRASGGTARLVDVGTRSEGQADVSNETVAAHHPLGSSAALGQTDRNVALEAMGDALATYLSQQSDLGGVIGLGGSGNTGMVTRAMRALPIGLPKVMVSTIASGDVSPYVGESDIFMVSPITDIAGLNRINRGILGNAAAAVTAMTARRADFGDAMQKPEIGLTQFGVTTNCVDAVRSKLSDRFECLSFHATGTGGRTLEKLVSSGLLTAVIDLTTTEIADHIVGGVLSAGERRLDAIATSGTPCVLSLGALDIVNFWAPETIPESFADRLFHMHNPEVTLMRTSAVECTEIGRWIARKLNKCNGPVLILAPMGGFSALDAPGHPFWNPEADEALVAALESTLELGANRQIKRLDCNINDLNFATMVTTALDEVLEQAGEST